MAEKKNNNASKNNTAKKKTSAASKSGPANGRKTGSSKKPKKNPAGSRIKDEIIALGMIAFGIFLMISMMTTATGAFGEVFSMVLKGLFGVIAYALPFLLLIYGLLVFLNRMAHVNSRSVFFSVLLILDLTMLNSVRFEDIWSPAPLREYISQSFSSGNYLESAGVIGMLAGRGAADIIGSAGMIIAGIALLAVCLIIIVDTPVSVFFDRLREKRNQKLIDREEERAEYERLTAERREIAARAAEIRNAENERKRAKALAAAADRELKKQAAEEKRMSHHVMRDNYPDAIETSISDSGKAGRGEAGKQAGSVSPFANLRIKGASIFRGGPTVEEEFSLLPENQRQIMDYMKNDDLFDDTGRNNDASELRLTDNGDAELDSFRACDFFYDIKSISQRMDGLPEKAEKDQPSGLSDDINDGDRPEGLGLKGDEEEFEALTDLADLEDLFRDEAFIDDITVKKENRTFEEGDKIYEVLYETPKNDRDSAYPDEVFTDRQEPDIEERYGHAQEHDIDEGHIYTEDPGAGPEAAWDTGSRGPGAGGAAGAAVPAAGPEVQVPKEMTKGEMKAAVAQGAAELGAVIDQTMSQPEKKQYVLPPLSLLYPSSRKENRNENRELADKAAKLEQVLRDFGVNARVIDVKKGPSVTRYEIQPATGVKVNSITKLADDIALNLEAKSLRIEAPIPGKAAVGIEVENESSTTVTIREMIDSPEFEASASKISFVVGENIAGSHIVADLKGMPHLLIAGSTGSGKSVCINSIIMSILYKSTPDEVRLILIDPKVVELGNYNGIPHMLIPVVTDPSKAAAALAWAVQEMNDRYRKFADTSVRDLKGYNEKMRKEGQEDRVLPQIVIIIDELADLMMAAAKQVEESICRLAQLARAAGMHLIVATQRPSVDVVTGLIKANIPSRIAFAVSSQVDSRTILDRAGAEKLVGKGDMLFNPLGKAQPERLQGPFVTDDEVTAVIDFWKDQADDSDTAAKIMEAINTSMPEVTADDGDEEDELLQEAIELVLDTGQASASMLQRRYRIGYNRAGRLIDIMEARGIIGRNEGSRPRRVLMTKEEYEGLSRQQTSDDMDSGMEAIPQDGASAEPSEPVHDEKAGGGFSDYSGE